MNFLSTVKNSIMGVYINSISQWTIVIWLASFLLFLVEKLFFIQWLPESVLFGCANSFDDWNIFENDWNTFESEWIIYRAHHEQQMIWVQGKIILHQRLSFRVFFIFFIGLNVKVKFVAKFFQRTNIKCINSPPLY